MGCWPSGSGLADMLGRHELSRQSYAQAPGTAQADLEAVEDQIEATHRQRALWTFRLA
jgi:hypothetical protein